VNGLGDNEAKQELGRMVRRFEQGPSEVSAVTSPGARTSAWAIKVKSLVEYNVYEVCTVIVGPAGTLPVEIGSEIEAVNLAESFMADGGLPAGTYAVMSKVGEKYVFYAPV
jgi:hypothetical protein